MAQKIEVEFELKYKEAVKNLDEFQKEYAKLEKKVVTANEKTASALEKVEKNAKSGATGIRAVGVSIKALAKASGIIFLLQKAFEFVSDAVQQNQEVMDGLNVVFNTAQILFNQVVNAVVDIYKSVSSATENFDALGKVMGGILTLFINPFKLAFFGIKLALQQAQFAWEDSFFGGGDEDKLGKLQLDILETQKAIRDTGDEMIDAGKDIVNNFSEAVTEVGAIGETVVEEFGKVSVKTALETAKTNTALKKSAEIAAAQSRILLEQFDRQAEIQRQIRDDETKSIAERQEANNKLNDILVQQEEEMTKNAQLVKAAAQAQFDLTGKTEDYVAVLDAEAEIQAVAAQITGFKSEQQTNANALLKEATELTNAQAESESTLTIAKQRLAAEQIENELLRLQELQRIDGLEKEQETKRLQAIVDNANAGTQAKIDAQIALNDFIAQSDEQDVARTREISAAKIEIANEEAEAKKKTLNDTANVLQNFSSIAGEETAAGKAFAVAAATINTYRGVSDALAAVTVTPFETALKFANAAAIGVAGIANVKKILSVKVPGGSGGAPSGGTPTTTTAQPPAFNVVGASGETQLADAIGSQTQRPARAYVVSNDVTTAQELDRNIIEGASI